MTKRVETQEPSQWDRYEALFADDAVRTTDRFQDAGAYANFVETPDTTDEEWAVSFFDAYQK